MSMEKVAKIESTQKEQLDRLILWNTAQRKRDLVFWLPKTDDLQLCNIISQQIAEMKESVKDNKAKLAAFCIMWL